MVAFCGGELGPGQVEFANVSVQIPGGSPGSTPRDGR